MVSMQDNAMRGCSNVGRCRSTSRVRSKDTDDSRSHRHPCAQLWVGISRSSGKALTRNATRRLRFITHAASLAAIHVDRRICGDIAHINIINSTRPRKHSHGSDEVQTQKIYITLHHTPSNGCVTGAMSDNTIKLPMEVSRKIHMVTSDSSKTMASA